VIIFRTACLQGEESGTSMSPIGGSTVPVSPLRVWSEHNPGARRLLKGIGAVLMYWCNLGTLISTCRMG
jgi:hypothetical protein